MPFPDVSGQFLLDRRGMTDTKMTNKIDFKPGNMLYPLPAVMVSCGEGAGANILTVAWAGTVCTNPPMVSISLRPERHSYPLIKESGEFVINLVTEKLARAMDYCGVRSGRDRDKWQDCGLTKAASRTVGCPSIAESPVNIECKVRSVEELGSHTMFVAEVTAVRVDDAYMTESGAFDLNAAGLLVYSHGTYFGLGKTLGTFGYSIKKENPGKKAGKKSSGGKQPGGRPPGIGKKQSGGRDR